MERTRKKRPKPLELNNENNVKLPIKDIIIRESVGSGQEAGFKNNGNNANPVIKAVKKNPKKAVIGLGVENNGNNVKQAIIQ